MGSSTSVFFITTTAGTTSPISWTTTIPIPAWGFRSRPHRNRATGFDATFEAEYAPLSSGSVSQLDDSPDWDISSTDIRKAEVAFSNERFGKLWLGQGSMASDVV